MISRPGNLVVGDYVYVGTGNDRCGKIKFIGETQFSNGEWIGVELNTPSGKNDGSVDGIRYFDCVPSHGIFSKRDKLRLVPPSSRPPSPTGSSIGGKLSGIRHPSVSSLTKPISRCETPPINDSTSSSFNVGDRVQVSGGRVGTLRFLGSTDLGPGQWAGVELDEALGKNDGTAGGKRYFTCRPSCGLFVLSTKLASVSGVIPKGLSTSQQRQSQESLLSYCSNLSSVSRSYRAQYSPAGGVRSTTAPTTRRSSMLASSITKEPRPSPQALQRLVREKEEHIDQLLKERDIERSDLARATLDRETAEVELSKKHNQIGRLNQQLEKMESAYALLQSQHDQLVIRLQDEKKNLEDLQFRMEEENINKDTLESMNADDESKIFELEEALMSAREMNERVQAELKSVRAQLADALRQKAVAPLPSAATDCKRTSHGPLEIQSASSMSIEPTVDTTTTTTQQAAVPEKGDTLQADLDGLRQQLTEREHETEEMLKRQAHALELLTTDYEQQLQDMKAKLVTANSELLVSKDECSSFAAKAESQQNEFQSTVADLKTKLETEEQKARDKLQFYENRLAELTNIVDNEKQIISPTTLEQAIALRNIEEKLKLTEEQLRTYQTSVLSMIQQVVREQLDQTTPPDDVDHNMQLLCDRLKQQEFTISQQLIALAEAENAHHSSLSKLSASDSRLQELESSLENMRSELHTSIQKQDGLTEALDSAKSIRDQLVGKITEFLGDSSMSLTDSGPDIDHLVQTLSIRFDELTKLLSEAEIRNSDLEARVSVLETERNDLEREINLIKASSPIEQDNDKVDSLTQELTSARNKITSLESKATAALENLESKSVELRTLQEKLDQTLEEHTRLKQSHADSMTILEAEKQRLQEQILASEAAIATGRATELVSAPNEDEAKADSQIAFLNAIIVDLHKKNAELEERIRSSLVTFHQSPSETSNHRVKIPKSPRPWCDNCLVFDSHETENCHLKSNDEDGVNGKFVKRHISYHQQPEWTSNNRLYCDICGVFDNHSSEECRNNESF